MNLGPLSPSNVLSGCENFLKKLSKEENKELSRIRRTLPVQRRCGGSLKVKK